MSSLPNVEYGSIPEGSVWQQPIYYLLEVYENYSTEPARGLFHDSSKTVKIRCRIYR